MNLPANKAIVFDGIHYLHIFTWLLTKRYDKLADNLVNINGNMFQSKEEAIALMKERTRKIDSPGLIIFQRYDHFKRREYLHSKVFCCAGFPSGRYHSFCPFRCEDYNRLHIDNFPRLVE